MSNHFLASTPQDLARTLQEESRRMQEQEASSKAKSLGLPYINLHNFPLDINTLSLMTHDEAINSQSVPIFKEGKSMRVATVNPSNALLRQKIAEFSPKYKVDLYLISPASLEQVLKNYAQVVVPTSTFQDSIQIEPNTDYVAMLKGFASSPTPPTPSQLITACFGAALFYNASDIHLEPEETFIKIRLRIDGVLQDTAHISKLAQRSLTARIKTLSKLKLNIENLPQDGRLTIYNQGVPVDIRISTLPSSYGEGLVLRLLGTGAKDLTLKDLGLQGRSYQAVENALAQPNGMVITTGPTGSGKTTTLYAFLNELNNPGVKIITLEDPVEYKLEGIQQTPIDHNVDFSFAKGLKAILRQDPDIVMVGEIRDGETAETALQAALTGHIVLSTLHTNDASGAVPRLVTMGAKPFIIAPALTIIIAQRLVRKLCTVCRKPATLEPALLQKVQAIIDAIPKNAGVEIPQKFEFFTAPGCEACSSLGYKGRLGIFEIVEVNEAVKQLILDSASASKISQQATSDGMLTMAQDGLLKALSGITDVEEVFRVAGN
jgi:type IV pilus assembly protein PilB